ncbi:MAG: glycosyltransferase [Candidatus Sungbacteria bacterium]|uniref:Glycosyltransferase n=1 Tax=Candidatus Sungiibacteriota bacterium TaxID=2750080 RepID=A0A931SB53_9BACT|nr:glycosyltransferase [Candidatus Sungbacteria bacterium]
MPKLSIVIAAYNEEKRLPETLERLFGFLERASLSYEIVIVDDGSRDRTLELVKKRAETKPQLRYLTHFPNRGRGVSIREGVLASAGEFVLETDADGSVADEAILRFLKHFAEHPEIDAVFGSRELPGSRIARHQPILRIFLGQGFILLAKILFRMWCTTDFTLGFKMFRRRAATDIFQHQFDSHFLAEAEIAYVAKRRKWNVTELPVTWSDNRDSRVRPLRDSFRSFQGMIKILWRDVRGKYIAAR